MNSEQEIKLYNYYRSSASYRVRIALNIKELTYKYIPIHLIKDGGEQFSDEYKRLNPMSLVPFFDDGRVKIHQSFVIMEYLDNQFPEPKLIPENFEDNLYVKSLSLDIACDIHPMNNLRVLKYITGQLYLSEAEKNKWIHHWINLGFDAIEEKIKNSGKNGSFSVGDHPTMVECFLVPQIYNARRFNVDMSQYPTLCLIEKSCLKLKAFEQAHPDNQPDAG